MPALPRLAVGAMRGGLGKTTFSLGIIAAWRKQGRRVAVFKKGPDFIDAGWLGLAAKRPCYNLDLFMMDPGRVVRSFNEHTAGVDGAVIEGNRGLFDGVDESGSYSTARLARMLDSPVMLIVDCTKSTGTVAAVVLGCRQYDPAVRLGGVLLNNIASQRHEMVIRKAIAQSSGIPVLGAVPRQKGDAFPERHMGLTPFHEHPEAEQAIEACARLAGQYLDLDAIWNAAASAPDILDREPGGETPKSGDSGERVTIGVIRDTAFQFYYPDNLEALEQSGAVIRELNALRDPGLPENLDALYIGGGFPETQAAELAANAGFCHSIRKAVERGLPVYAECGGLIYLGRSLTVGNQRFSMTGALPLDFVLEKKPQAHGYTVLEAGDAGVFIDKDVVVRGHEFHYSRVDPIEGPYRLAYKVRRGVGIDGRGDGFILNNVVAAYTHIHALATPEWAPSVVQKARAYRGRKTD
ncbi:MAG TPA: cobyrinate a,c-diamide synthase [Nitrospirota bacterium]|nr:cobyrinate a,c-diamide synthase [Nitrospirota bacterium]